MPPIETSSAIRDKIRNMLIGQDGGLSLRQLSVAVNVVDATLFRTVLLEMLADGELACSIGRFRY